MTIGPRKMRAASGTRSSGLYHTPPRSCNLPQVTDFKQFLRVRCLTLFESGTYTSPVSDRRAAVAVLLAAVAIIAIGERPTILTDYTSGAADLQKGIGRLWSLPGTGAYLLDAIIEVCQGIKKREARRPVIVAITEEGPEFSNRHYDQVLDPL